MFETVECVAGISEVEAGYFYRYQTGLRQAAGPEQLLARLADGRLISELLGTFAEDRSFSPVTQHFSGMLVHSAPPTALPKAHAAKRFAMVSTAKPALAGVV